VVIVDPVNSLLSIASDAATRSMLTRLIDFLKLHGVTALFTSLNAGGDTSSRPTSGFRPLIDTWLTLSAVRSGGERNRVLSIVKSRGMAHSNQSVEYLLTDRGLRILDTYLGAGEPLTGSRSPG